MKTLNRILLPALLGLILLSCEGMDHRREEKPRRVILPANEVREGWYFAAGDRVVIDGTVNGDAYVAGGIIEINGTINGDLLVAGGQVTVGGKVTDDVRAAGGALRFDGKVGKNITAAGGSITFGKTAEAGNVLVAGGAVQLGGRVLRNVKIGAGELSVSGNVGGNVEFMGGELSVLEGAKIAGNLEARMRDTTLAEIAPGTVKGTIDVGESEWRPHRRILGLQPFHFWLKLFLMFSLLATGLVAIIVFPGRFIEIGSNILESPGRSLLWGIVLLVAVPVIALLLCLTIIGIPLALWATAVLLWVSYLSQLTLGIAVGQRFFKLQEDGWWGMFWRFGAGLIIVQILTFVPYLRTLVILAGLIFGVGAIAMVVKDQAQRVRRA